MASQAATCIRPLNLCYPMGQRSGQVYYMYIVVPRETHYNSQVSRIHNIIACVQVDVLALETDGIIE